MFEKPYVERLAEVFDKMPVDHDCRDQKASNLNRWNFYGKQHTECKQSESHDGPERMWADHNDQGKENKEKLQGTLPGTHLRKTDQAELQMEGGNCFTAFFFLKKMEMRVRNTGAMSTGIKSSECTSKKGAVQKSTGHKSLLQALKSGRAFRRKIRHT